MHLQDRETLSEDGAGEMDLAARRQPPTVRLRRLAGELRALRTAAGLTRDDVSEATGMNSATLYRIETAKVRPQRRTLMALLDKYGVTDEVKRADLIALSKNANEPIWLRAFEDNLTEVYGAYIALESEARSVRNYESLLVPGLLQTEEYAREITRAALPLASADEIERRVKVRMERKGVLHKKTPLQMWAIMDEATICRRVGGADVMAEQLEALITAAAARHVVVQVIPYELGAHAGMGGSFVVMDFPDPADSPLVYAESAASDMFLERTSDVQRYSDTFEHLRAAALNPSASLDLIQHHREVLNGKGARDG
jgi:transcriptional regulator with XRE-family HTH domain